MYQANQITDMAYVDQLLLVKQNEYSAAIRDGVVFIHAKKLFLEIKQLCAQREALLKPTPGCGRQHTGPAQGGAVQVRF